jgi:hypothetical protein
VDVRIRALCGIFIKRHEYGIPCAATKVEHLASIPDFGVACHGRTRNLHLYFHAGFILIAAIFTLPLFLCSPSA